MMTTPGSVSRSVRIYACLMWLYPRSFREGFTGEMVQVFTAQCTDAYTARGLVGVAAVWAHALVDLAGTAIGEWGSAAARVQTMKVAGIVVVAVLVGVALGYVNLHNDEPEAPMAILLVSTFLLGLSAPRGAWRWAVIVGLAVPLSALLSLKVGVFYPCRQGHSYSCDGSGSLGSALSLLVLLLPAFVSTYLGVLARRSLRLRREA